VGEPGSDDVGVAATTETRWRRPLPTNYLFFRMKQVERIKMRLGFASAGVLKRIEIAPTLLIQSHNFAIEDE
jgi:hypothetical protein